MKYFSKWAKANAFLNQEAATVDDVLRNTSAFSESPWSYILLHFGA